MPPHPPTSPAAAVLQSYATVPIDLLLPHPNNPHKGDAEVIADSIGANGFYGAVIAQASTKRIIAGHHRVLAAKMQGLKEVPVLLLDVDDEQAVRIMLADNRTAEFGGYDDAALATVLSLLPSIEGTGWSQDDFADLDAALAIDTTMLEQPLAPPRPPSPPQLDPRPEPPAGHSYEEAYENEADLDEEDLRELVADMHPAGDAEDDGRDADAPAPRPWAVLVTCQSQEARDELMAKLTEDGWNARVLA